MKAHLIVDQEYYDTLIQLVHDSNCKAIKIYSEALIIYFRDTGVDAKSKVRPMDDEIFNLRNTIVR